MTYSSTAPLVSVYLSLTLPRSTIRRDPESARLTLTKGDVITKLNNPRHRLWCDGSGVVSRPSGLSLMARTILPSPFFSSNCRLLPTASFLDITFLTKLIINLDSSTNTVSSRERKKKTRTYNKENVTLNSVQFISPRGFFQLFLSILLNFFYKINYSFFESSFIVLVAFQGCCLIYRNIYRISLGMKLGFRRRLPAPLHHSFSWCCGEEFVVAFSSSSFCSSSSSNEFFVTF